MSLRGFLEGMEKKREVAHVKEGVSHVLKPTRAGSATWFNIAFGRKPLLTTEYST